MLAEHNASQPTDVRQVRARRFTSRIAAQKSAFAQEDRSTGACCSVLMTGVQVGAGAARMPTFPEQDGVDASHAGTAPSFLRRYLAAFEAARR